jgi:hypothetical protein
MLVTSFYHSAERATHILHFTAILTSKDTMPAHLLVALSYNKADTYNVQRVKGVENKE